MASIVLDLKMDTKQKRALPLPDTSGREYLWVQGEMSHAQGVRRSRLQSLELFVG